MRRRAGAFQLDCDCVRQPLLVASWPLHKNAGSGGGPIKIPPGRYGVGVAQLLGQGTIVVTDLTRDFAPPVPTICGNRDRFMRRVDNHWDPHWHVTIHCKSATWARYGHANGACAFSVCHAPPPLARFRRELSLFVRRVRALMPGVAPRRLLYPQQEKVSARLKELPLSARSGPEHAQQSACTEFALNRHAAFDCVAGARYVSAPWHPPMAEWLPAQIPR